MLLLEVRGLRFTAPGASAPTVDLERLELAAGERLAVRGASGSGKTSLLRCIIGLERADSGTVKWRGEPVADGDYPGFRCGCCYLPQKPVGTQAHVGEDLAFARAMSEVHRRPGRLDADAQRELLGRLGLADLPWEREFEQLSVGEQQRVSLVRALTVAPSVLLLDEPTSALDPDRVERIEQLLLSWIDDQPGPRALVWVTHQARQAARVGTRELVLHANERESEREAEPDA